MGFYERVKGPVAFGGFLGTLWKWGAWLDKKFGLWNLASSIVIAALTATVAWLKQKDGLDIFLYGLWSFAAVLIILAVVHAFIDRRKTRNLQLAELARQAAMNSALNGTISIECQMSGLPKILPTSGVVYSIQLYGSPIEGGGIMRHVNLVRAHGATDGSMDWGGVKYAYKCQIKNLGPAVISNLQTAFKIVFHEWIKTDNGFRSGDQTGEYAHEISISALAPSHGVFELYIMNMGWFAAGIVIPKNASLLLAGETQRRDISFAPQFIETGFFLQPLMPENHTPTRIEMGRS